MPSPDDLRSVATAEPAEPVPRLPVLPPAAPAGGTQTVRLLDWSQGAVQEPDDSTNEPQLGDWREYRAYAAANPARGQQTASHRKHYERRVEDRGRKFL